MVQVKYSFFLDPEDYGYSKHLVDAPDIPKEPYAGKDEDYQEWIDSLPKVKRANPFHNHFVLFGPEVSLKEISDKGGCLLAEAYKLWENGRPVEIRNPWALLPILVSSGRRQACSDKINIIKGGAV